MTLTVVCSGGGQMSPSQVVKSVSSCGVVSPALNQPSTESRKD